MSGGRKHTLWRSLHTSSNYFRRSLPASFAALTLFGSFVLVGQTSPPAGQSSPPSTPEKKEKKEKKRQIDESDTAAPRGETGSAVGGIVLRPDGKPAAGTDIVLTSVEDPNQRWTTKADRTGHFRFDAELAPGPYVATATAKTLTSPPAKISLSGTRVAPLRLRLRARSQ
jgi:hypothetical protein